MLLTGYIRHLHSDLYSRYKPASIELYRTSAKSFIMHVVSVGMEINNIDETLIPDWIDALETKGYKKNTQNTYKKHVINHFIPFLKKLKNQRTAPKRLRLRRHAPVPPALTPAPEPAPVPVSAPVSEPPARDTSLLTSPSMRGAAIRRRNPPEIAIERTCQPKEEEEEEQEPLKWNLFVMLLLLVEIYVFLQLFNLP